LPEPEPPDMAIRKAGFRFVMRVGLTANLPGHQ
jgi:hypothetical protein